MTDRDHLAILSIDCIEHNQNQSRQVYDEGELKNLAKSIKDHGVINPIAVSGPFSRDGKKVYIVLDGERRLRASVLAGKKTIPAHIKDVEENDANNQLIISIVANLQRVDINPIEEARAYKKLCDIGFTHFGIARMVGKGRTAIENRLFLLKFEPEVQDLYAERKLNLDMRVYYLLQQMEPELRVRTAKELALSGADQTGAIEICTKIVNHSEIKIKTDSDAKTSSDIEENVNSSPTTKLSDIDTLLTNLITETELPEGLSILKEACTLVCKNCSLLPYASNNTCQDCPAVDLIRTIIQIQGG